MSEVFVAVVISLFAAGGMAACGSDADGSGAALTTNEDGVFGLGVLFDDKDPDAVVEGWMRDDVEIPWTYASSLLDGGIDGALSWATREEAGRYPLTVAEAADSRGHMPVFTLFHLQETKGPCVDCPSDQASLHNLNDPELMKRYFGEFRLLMQRLGSGTTDGVDGFDKPAIVHVEPNLAGYAQQGTTDPEHCFGFCDEGRPDDPSAVHAAVSSSCDPDAAGLPDTFAGFNAALLRIRDRYAPKVRLAYNLTGWATLVDIAGDRTPTIDVAGIGRRVAAFAAANGVAPISGVNSTYDLVMHDLNWGASGYWKYSAKSDTYWDALNQREPSFTRGITFMATTTEALDRPMILWQISPGNQRYRSMNNTPGHYQDNKAEYLLSHAEELVAKGVVGMLLWPGPATSTHWEDFRKDGITNPEPSCTSDGLSKGELCADKMATVADDDGGFVREESTRYYRSPVKVPAATIGPLTGGRAGDPVERSDPPATCRSEAPQGVPTSGPTTTTD